MLATLRALLVVLALATPVLAGCITLPTEDIDRAVAPFESLLTPRVFEGYLHESADVTIPVGLTGVKVHLDLWRPDPATYTGADPAGAEAPVPVVVDIGPYFGSGKQGEDRRSAHYVHQWMFDHMIPRGYALAAVELPGTGGSTGCFDFMGPQEVAASAAAVDWLGEQAWSSGKVGMIGKSYDGMTQIMAASEHPERLATMVPVAPLTHAYGGVYMNGVPYDFWPGVFASYMVLIGVAEVPTHTPERMPGYVEKLPGHAACQPENVAFGVGGMGDYNDYYAARDFRASAKDITIPTFFMQGFLDRNVRADNAFPYVNDLAGPKMVWIGQWHHDYANATFAGREDMYETLHLWFDRWLKDIDNGIEEELGFHVQDNEGRWRREASWPPADARGLTFRLANAALSPDPAATGAGADFLDDAGTTAWLSPGQSSATRAEWVSEPFATETRVAGPVALALNVTSSGPRGQVVAYLWDCDEALAECVVVTRGAMSLLHRNGLAKGEPLAPGEVASLAFTLQPRDYAFAAGRVAVLSLAGTDDDWFQPEATRNVITILESAESPSTMTLPVVARTDADSYLVACGNRLPDKACFDPARRDRYPARRE